MRSCRRVHPNSRKAAASPRARAHAARALPKDARLKWEAWTMPNASAVRTTCRAA